MYKPEGDVSDGAGPTVIEDCSFIGNAARAPGGGFFVTDLGKMPKLSILNT